MPAKRLIDLEHGTRTRPMRVLALGLCRTGTLSLYSALGKLGYKPYHMIELVKDPARNFPLWSEALRAHALGGGEQYGRAELDKMIGDYDAVLDVPCCLFAEELMAAYPDAKVILNVRNPDKWIASMSNTVYKCASWSSWKYIARYEGQIGKYWYPWVELCMSAITNDWTTSVGEYNTPEYHATARKAFVRHYDHIRQAVGKGNLLEHKPQDGWGPLCKFLGHEVPDEEYPNTNDETAFVTYHTILWRLAVIKTVAKLCLPVVAVAGGVLAWRLTNKSRL